MIATLFLAVCTVVLVIQSAAFWRIERIPASTVSGRMVRRGLIRTALFRITAASMYVALGLVEISGHPKVGLELGVFTVVQFFWVINAGLDIRLRCRLAQHEVAQ